ncbi:MAG: hypothetical protein HON04_12025 [Planctomicrobium sp.]|nr:hypothetical protein [Planctomicrobium sp.]
MATTERPIWTSLPARIVMTIVVIGILAALMIPTGGPGPGEIVKPPTDPTVPVETGCTRDLQRILGGMSPGRLGINTGSDDLAVELNRWFAKCGEDIEEELTNDAELQKEYFSPELYQALQEERFLPSDIEHVRMSLLAKQIVENVSGEIEKESDKVVALFEFVSNHIILLDTQNSTISDLPATPYESLVWGLGSVEHRAWTFATLLRQIRIDAFIVIPQSQPDMWLIGVHVPEVGVQLFEPRLGLPIPSLPDSPVTSSSPVATLSSVKEDNAPLTQFAVNDFQYPLTKDELKEVSIKLIGSPSLWANRIAKLQYMISPLDGVQLYDGIGPNALRSEGAQRERIIELGKQKNLWDESQVEVWQYPLEQIAAFASAQQSSNHNLMTFEAIFAGPQLLKVDSLTGQAVEDVVTGAPVYAAAKTTLHAVRIEQLLGQHQEALPHFGPILTSHKTNPSPLNEEAATFAALWIGISQMGTNRLTAAENSFDRFTSTFRQSQTQLVPIDLLQVNAYRWKAIVQLKQGGMVDAVETLKASQATQPSQRDAWLIQRWEKQLSK